MLASLYSKEVSIFEKYEFLRFEIPKNGSTDERTRAGKRFLALAVRSGEQHWPVL